MKTPYKTRLVFPDLIAINGKIYKPVVLPITTDHLTGIESVEKMIVLKEVKPKDKP